MEFKLFTIYDSKIETHNRPMILMHKGEALRIFEQEANREDSNICKYPGDYTLFEIGKYDDQSGNVTMHKTHISLGLAIEWKKPPEQAPPLLEAMGGDAKRQNPLARRG